MKYLPLLLVIGLLAGCGTDDEQAVRDQVKTMLNAMADGDGAAGCATFTQEGQDSFEIDLKLDQEPAPADCPAGFEDFAATIRDGTSLDLDSAEVDRVEIDGDSATAGIEGSEQTFDLEKVDGDWLIGPIN